MTDWLPQGWGPFVVAGFGAVIVAAAGGLLTDLGDWYMALRQPAWKPPDWAFGPAWTIIFALAAASAGLAWGAAATNSQRAGIVAMFVANALLNMLWSVLFFKLHRPDWALIEVVFLWLSVLAPIVWLATLSSAASWLLVPYLVWVTFASTINWGVIKLNPDMIGGMRGSGQHG
jgi:translocator protein